MFKILILSKPVAPYFDTFEFWRKLGESWEDLIIQNNAAIVSNYDIWFDTFCEMFCKTIKPQMREWITNYSKHIAEKRKKTVTTSPPR
jgi:hypothetical protein